MMPVAVSNLIPPTTTSGPGWLLILLAILGAGGGLRLAWDMWQRYRRGAVEDARQIRMAVTDQLDSSDKLFERYKVELEDARRQLQQYLQQLVAVNRELGQTMGRINKLEADLHDARGEVVVLREELGRALEQRDQLHKQVQELQERIRLLEDA